MTLVSIILPVFNNAKTLEKCLKSIFNQTYKNWELIIIDDGSSDDYLKIVNKFKDSRLRLYVNHKNLGLPATLNFGILKSSGELIARIDADDFCIRNRIEKQLNFFKKNPHIDLLGSNCIYFNKFYKKFKSNVPIGHNEIFKKIYKRNVFIHSSIMFRRSFFRENNGYSEFFKKCQDHDLWLRGIKIDNYCNLKDVLVFHNFELKKKIDTYFYGFLVIFLNNLRKKKIFSALFFSCIYLLSSLKNFLFIPKYLRKI